MLIVYKRIPAKTLRKEAKDAIAQVEAWFKSNPTRTNCNAELFYGRMLDLKPATVKQQIDELVKELIAEDKASKARKAKG
jgi:hypothetical protein